MSRSHAFHEHTIENSMLQTDHFINTSLKTRFYKQIIDKWHPGLVKHAGRGGEHARTEWLKMLLSEKSILQTCRSSGNPFVSVLRFSFQDSDRLYIGMDFYPGGNLAKLRNQQPQKRFRQDWAQFYIAEVVQAVGHLHNLDITHRDIKGPNCMIDREGHVKLIDFGLSHESFVSLSPITGRVGTVTHMAPELFVREAQYTKEVDWWSVGVLLFEMLVGEDPFESKTCKHLEKKLLEREIIRRITSNDFKIAYPEFMSDSAKRLLQGLFNRDPTKRLGARGSRSGCGPGQIRASAFFQTMDWERLDRLEMQPFWKPPAESAVSEGTLDDVSDKNLRINLGIDTLSSDGKRDADKDSARSSKVSEFFSILSSPRNNGGTDNEVQGWNSMQVQNLDSEVAFQSGSGDDFRSGTSQSEMAEISGTPPPPPPPSPSKISEISGGGSFASCENGWSQSGSGGSMLDVKTVGGTNRPSWKRTMVGNVRRKQEMDRKMWGFDIKLALQCWMKNSQAAIVSSSSAHDLGADNDPFNDHGADNDPFNDHVLCMSALFCIATTNILELSDLRSSAVYVTKLLCHCFRIMYKYMGHDFEGIFGSIDQVRKLEPMKTTESDAENRKRHVGRMEEVEDSVYECLEVTLWFLYKCILSSRGYNRFLFDLVSHGIVEIIFNFMGHLCLRSSTLTVLFGTICLLLSPEVHHRTNMDDIIPRVLSWADETTYANAECDGDSDSDLLNSSSHRFRRFLDFLNLEGMRGYLLNLQGSVDIGLKCNLMTQFIEIMIRLAEIGRQLMASVLFLFLAI